MHVFNFIHYYFWASYRRKSLDRLLEQHKSLFHGIVLDIGGRDRGMFQKPKQDVEKWIFADINPEHHPDIVLDVSQMTSVEENSVDVILATELFEHVRFPESGLNECGRTLKQNGHLIISVPFLYAVHADPFDFQRWTDVKWKKELTEAGFTVVEFQIMGTFFTVFCDQIKMLIRSLPTPFKQIGYLLFPLFDLLVLLDNTPWLQRKKRLSNTHGGYFIVALKIGQRLIL